VLPGAFQQGLPPSARRAATAGRNARATQSRQKPQVLHAPGLWVLYFSFAAVPVFGLGELLLNTNDAVGRRACFGWLVAYLAAALCLLFLTSFLGLRRYLRQKYLIMPRAMAGAWVATGLALTVSALVLALLLPRPATPYSLAALVTKLTVLPQEASRYAPQRSEGGEGQSRSRADGQQGEKAPDAAAGAEQQRPERLDNRGQPSGGSGSGSQSQGIKSPVSPPAVSFPLARWIPYLVAAAVAVFALVRFWPEISAGFRSFLGLLSKPRRKEKKTLPKPRSSSSGEGEAVRLLPNPFHTGQASRMSLSELVQYSYEGLTLWAKARGFALDPSETPIELAERLSQKEPALTHEILLLSSYYSHVTYGNQPPPEECLTVLKSLWSIIGFGPAR
jgi:hypothetical protein